MFAPLMLTAPLSTFKSKLPMRAIVRCFFRLTVSSDFVSDKMSSLLFFQLQSLKFRWIAMGSSSSDSSCSGSESGLSGSRFGGVDVGSGVISGAAILFAAASALNLAAAMALRGFTLVVTTSRCSIRTVSTLRQPK